MKVEIFISDKLKDFGPTAKQLQHYLQQLANRTMQGHARYGRPQKSKKYLSRLKRELRAYERTGNAENLLNSGVYHFLESIEPENEKFHFDPKAPSVTRAEFGGQLT